MVRNWHIDSDSHRLLDVWLTVNQPRNILEIGSGLTTKLFADYVFEHPPASFLSLEHDPKWLEHTKKTYGVKSGVVLAPLKPTEQGMFYDYRLPDQIDFCLIDGPPATYGRLATFYQIYPHLAKDFTIWLDDVNRPHEKDCLAKWQADFPIQLKRLNGRVMEIKPL